MVKLYLIRHGKTVFNEKETVQGWNDSPLTKEGIYQAKCAGYGAKDIVFDRAYSGDASRQIDTASVFLKENNHPIEIISDYHFREMCYGKYEGGTYYDMLNPLYEEMNKPYEAYPGLYKYYTDVQIANRLMELDETGKTEGINKTYQRFKEGLDMIIAENKNGNILISTSSIAIASVIYNLFPEQKQDGLVENASICVIAYDGEYHLEEYNNTSYRKAGEKYYAYEP